MALTPDGARTVETTIRIDDVAPERVIEAFLRDDDLTAWWHVSRSFVEPVAGGAWSVAWDAHGEARTSHSWFGVVRELDERRLVTPRSCRTSPVARYSARLPWRLLPSRTVAGRALRCGIMVTSAVRTGTGYTTRLSGDGQQFLPK